jgi:signal transduction histidine kinase
VAELLVVPPGPRFAWTAGLLGAFAAALALIFYTEHARGKVGLVTVALAASALAIAIMAVGASPVLGAILFFIICTVVGMRLSLVAAIGWVGGAIASLLICELARGQSDWLSTTLSFGVGFTAFVAFAVSFRRSLQAQAESQQLLAELSGAQGRLRDMAVMEERQRLAREMHDAVGHRLTAAAVLLEGAGRLIPTDPVRATRMVETSRAQVRQGLDELRAAVSALRTDLPASQSLAEVLGALVDVFAQGASARVTLDLPPGLAEPDPDRKLVIIRTAQEALTNVQKHAAATSVELALRLDGNAYVLTCRDNGRGIPSGPTTAAPSAGSAPAGNGFGLGNLRSRAAPFGGRVELEQAPGGGALLRLTLPAGGGNPDA